MNARTIAWLAGLALSVVVLAPISFWGYLQLSDRPLSGIRVEGIGAPPVPLLPGLERHAELWESTALQLHVGQQQLSVTRASLGAQLLPQRIQRQLVKYGRSGNPLRDLRDAARALSGRLVIPWEPEIDRAALIGFVQREQRNVERPPITGVTDGEDFSLPGEDGRTLPLNRALATLERALAGHALEATLDVTIVKAPDPLLIGVPDAVLFDDAPPELEPSTTPRADASDEVGTATRPGEPQLPSVPSDVRFLPTTGHDCHEYRGRRFCDGPRRVAVPSAAAAALAGQLGLGEQRTVGRLLRKPPRQSWIQAAGGPSTAAGVLWPVPAGRCGRGFGFVRRKELRHRPHNGIDIVAKRGSPILAGAAGIVAYSDNRIRGFGNLLVIVHADGSVTFSAHCRAIFVAAGARVAAGQVVAEVGDTGLAMGPHLHFQYHDGGKPSDPVPALSGITASKTRRCR